ncbi:MAG: DUF4173 domain-containing protein [Saprospiraceae bacterium]|nr:DUF4173 domain-containing protein [Saprospiraceae bacterium]
MKKNDLILVLSVALYSLLFYHQALGINFFIFSIAMVGAFVVLDKELLKDKSWLGAAAGSIVSGFTVMYYGNGLAVTANVISLSLLSGLSISRGSSILLTLLYSAYSYVTAIAFMIVDLVQRKQVKSTTKGNSFWIKFGIGLIIFVVVILFFFLYQKSNSLFKNFTEQINFDWITWSWVRFTFLGFIILYGFFYHRNFPSWFKKDSQAPNLLNREKIENSENSFFGKLLNINVELYSGIVLFVLLNILILIVNILDIIYLWLSSGTLPEGMTYSEFVHQGTGNLIASIVFAILIILFYFRGHLNYFAKNKGIKALAFLWVVQNAFMVISAAYKNLLYVSEYSLTYKRIGVYIYLLLCLIGLITALVKIYKQKSNWYLFRKNSWALYLVLVLTALINWDQFITDFNIENSKSRIDKKYLVELNSTNIPELLLLAKDTSTNENYSYSDYDDDYNSYWEYNDGKTRGGYSEDFTNRIHNKMFKFLASHAELDWQSWCVDKNKTAKQIYKLHDDGKIKSLNLRGYGKDNLLPIQKFTKLEHLNISDIGSVNLEELKPFENLKTLELSSDDIYSIDKLPVMEQLEELYLDYNNIDDFSHLKNYSNLEILNIAENSDVELKSIVGLNKLKKLDISRNSIKDLSSLGQFPMLTELDLSSQRSFNFETFPKIESLEILNLSGNKFTNNEIKLLDKLRELDNLRDLNLANNSMRSLYILTNYYIKNNSLILKTKKEDEVVGLLPNIEKLNVMNNNINDISAIKYFQNLVYFNVSYNKVSNLSSLKDLSKIETLELNNNQISNLKGIEGLLSLKSLYLSNNSIIELKNLKDLSKLEYLDLSANNITDVSSLNALTELKLLKLSGNRINDISVLKNLKNLETLYLLDMTTFEISQLYEFTMLKQLYLQTATQEEIDLLKDKLKNTEVYVKHIKRENDRSFIR